MNMDFGWGFWHPSLFFGCRSVQISFWLINSSPEPHKRSKKVWLPVGPPVPLVPWLWQGKQQAFWFSLSLCLCLALHVYAYKYIKCLALSLFIYVLWYLSTSYTQRCIHKALLVSTNAQAFTRYSWFHLMRKLLRLMCLIRTNTNWRQPGNTAKHNCTYKQTIIHACIHTYNMMILKAARTYGQMPSHMARMVLFLVHLRVFFVDVECRLAHCVHLWAPRLSTNA